MRRVKVFWGLLLICLAAAGISFGQSEAGKVSPSDSKPAASGDPRRACPFSIIGVWKSEATSETNPIFYSFSPTGWVTVLGHTAGALPEDFEMITQAQYRLDNPVEPTRIEFTPKGKNEVFARGTTSLEIIQYTDDSFTITDLTSGYRTQWTRVEARRYFLTFAGGGRPLPQAPAPVLAMWTTLDGRKTKVEALGIQLTKDETGKPVPVFEPISAEVYSEFEYDGGSESEPKDEGSNSKLKAGRDSKLKVMMRLELTESDFERTHKVFETWTQFVKAKALPNSNPYLNAMEFLTKTAQSLNQCEERVKLHKPDTSKPDDVITRHDVTQRPVEYIRLMRKKNDEIHVTDGTFPWAWRPTLELSSPG
jgi:hypothetical protein